MSYKKFAKICSATLAGFGLFLGLAKWQSNAAAENKSLPFFHRQSGMQLSTRANGKIAFASNRNGFLDIYVMNANGTDQRQLTFGWINPVTGYRTFVVNPVWSPDGSKLAFVGINDFDGISVMNADGTGIKKVFAATRVLDILHVTWSADGTQLAFDGKCVDTSQCIVDIYKVNIDGTGVAKLTFDNQEENIEPSWSPDGTKIVFSSSRNGDYLSIYTMNPDGSNRVRLTNGAYDYGPQWSPDGARIAFWRAYDVWVMNADGSHLTQITTDHPASGDVIAWSPDGTKILFNHDSQVEQYIGALYLTQIYAVNIDGTGRQNLSNNYYHDYPGSWQPRIISATNPIDDAQFFVRQHYLDFLSREPDAAGNAFWTNQITSCGTDAQCIEVKRVNVSASYFLSIEFQESGYLVYRFYNAALNRANSLPGFIEFMRDTQRVSDGVIVTAPGWQQQLEQNKQAFAQEFVTRPEFTALYPETMMPAQYVDALYQHAGITPTIAERQAAQDEFNTPAGARGRVMRRVAENQTLFTREFNRAFVLSEYFGYLRRNPDDPPDGNMSGYNFWLNKLTAFNGNYIDAEMVKAFITSIEYRSRFGSP